ncbi:uncharacterized protein LOC129850364 isoform X1 [Salvelinus fontinalis]|uniref:uncharacterized protein LOC129850364 isoform X1 n=1 Tax=Salvelinus fontinalis TaxID=8038 RepID=UPI0024865ABD|nr:uncharacterized protein LOC129850364 isoform X1 [Salvelinus fontinalis]
MGLPALGLIPFLGPLAFPVALGTIAVGGFILIKAIHKKPSYHPGSPIITRSVMVKSNKASGNEPTGNAGSKKTEEERSSNETTIIIAYGLGVVDTYKNRLLAETILDGDAALMLRKAFIMGHPISSRQLREDAGLAAPYTDGNIDMSDEGTRDYYRYGYIELVNAYHKKGIINKNQAKKLISWVERDMHLDQDTQEYEEILDYIKRHFRVFRW